MVTHIVMWSFVPELSGEEKKAAGEKMKALLEPIRALVPGTLDIRVNVNALESSNREVMLFSTFETVEALQAYQTHPAHVEAGKYIRSVTCDRACMDFE